MLQITDHAWERYVERCGPIRKSAFRRYCQRNVPNQPGKYLVNGVLFVVVEGSEGSANVVITVYEPTRAPSKKQRKRGGHGDKYKRTERRK